MLLMGSCNLVCVKILTLFKCYENFHPKFSGYGSKCGDVITIGNMLAGAKQLVGYTQYVI